MAAEEATTATITEAVDGDVGKKNRKCVHQKNGLGWQYAKTNRFSFYFCTKYCSKK
jgi:hypothetical protein